MAMYIRASSGKYTTFSGAATLAEQDYKGSYKSGKDMIMHIGKMLFYFIICYIEKISNVLV